MAPAPAVVIMSSLIILVVVGICSRGCAAPVDDLPVRQIITVAIDGSGNFTSIGAAINSISDTVIGDRGYIKIEVAKGKYLENVKIVKKKLKILLVGAGINSTIISGNRSNGTGWRTFETATLENNSPGFIAVGLTIENTAGPENGQAVAVKNDGDQSIFYRCSFTGYQDTLYVHSGKQFYRECDIYGTVDFIFGDATVVLQNCNIYVRKPLRGQSNTITAQGREKSTKATGISIHNCTVKASADFQGEINSTKTYLGRPWKIYSRTVYIQSFMDELINPAGWLEWDGPTDSIYYGEYENRGPGANTSARVRWVGYHVLNAAEATRFTLFNFANGSSWIPDTKIPYIPGLI